MKKPGRIAPFFVALVCVLALVTSGCGMFGGGEEEQPGGQQGEDVPVLPVAQAGEEVVAEGEVVPVRSVELRFEQSGIVDEILVEEGSTVETGAELARLDTRDMVLAVEESEALLKQSKADYDLLVEGATDEEIAIAEISVEIAKANLDVYEALLASQRASVKSAEAEVARAQANLMQVRGAVTPADIASAEHSLEQAQLELADELDGPKATDVQQSQAALDQAVTNLREARDTLSSQKTSAYLEMQVAANNLRDRQLGYSDTYWDNRNVEQDFDSVNLDLPQRNKDREESDLRQVQNAEYNLEQARINYENAKLAEQTGIQVAEAKVRELQAQHNDLIDGSDPDVIAAARAGVAQAEANLAALQGEKRAGDLASAQAGITSAQAGVEQATAQLDKANVDLENAKLSVAKAEAELEQVLADPQKAQLDKSLAVVQQREVSLKQSELKLDKASIDAPFEGTVVEVNPKVGEWFGTTEVAITMADFTGWEIETTDLDELAVVNIDIGSLVRITFDALPDPGTAGQGGGNSKPGQELSG